MPPKQPVAGPSRPRQTPQTALPPAPPSSAGAFSPSQTLFALALPVLGSADKLTIWDVASDSVISEWEVEGASKVSTLCWAAVPSSGASGRKKRRKREGGGGGEEEAVVLTTEKGHVFVFSPTIGVLRKWDLPLRASAAWSDERGVFLATSTTICLLTRDAGSVAHTFALPPNTPSSTAISVLSSTPGSIQILLSSTSVIILDIDLSSDKVLSVSPPLPVATSSVTALHPLPPSDLGKSFLVVADDDRTISQYTLSLGSTKPRLSYRYASPTLSPAHSIAVNSDLLSVLHASGEVSLFPLPSELDFARPKSDTKPSTVRLLEGKTERQARLCRVAFASSTEEGPGALVCGRMAGGGRVKWYRAVYESPEGDMKSETVVKSDVQDLVGTSGEFKAVPLQRYKAPATAGELPEAETGEEPPSALPADVDMADLSLGERLLALPNGSLPNGDSHPVKDNGKPAAVIDGPVNAASLTRLLVQALHTSDPALLAVCLTTRDPILIRNTIRKLPSSMALPLLKACVERLGQGKGAGRRGGGRGTGQSEQQGRGTVEWVKGVLVERGSLLMTMPSLPLHLANLSQLLNTRLQLYQPLLSLSGRLDLALAQITLRRIAAEQAAAMQVEEGRRAEGDRYVEGESEEEEEDVVLEVGQGEGEVENVDMMANGTDEDDDDVEDGQLDEEDGDEDDEDEDEDEDEDDPLGSGEEEVLFGAEPEASGSDEDDSEDD